MTVTLKNIGCGPARYGAFALSHSLVVGGRVYGGRWLPTSEAGDPAGDVPVDGSQVFSMVMGRPLVEMLGRGGVWRVEVDPTNHTAELDEANNVSVFAN